MRERAPPTGDAIRSPRGRLPTWSWFCRHVTKRDGARPRVSVPCALPLYADSSPWYANPSASARATSAGRP
jgi:hypothetical protein